MERVKEKQNTYMYNNIGQISMTNRVKKVKDQVKNIQLSAFSNALDMKLKIVKNDSQTNQNKTADLLILFIN